MHTIRFNDSQMVAQLEQLSNEKLDALRFGVIGFDKDLKVRRYNGVERRYSGLSLPSVIGSHVFEMVAPCLNNLMVAGHYLDAAAANEPLDHVMEHVLTLRMRLTPARLRLLRQSEIAMWYLLIERQA
ncbi:MAG: PAS domain-containing protein [Herminiimonas sp.]|nr:PAS domain-containing protein [Herminiimonas sp.]